MPYYARSAYYPLPGAPQAAAGQPPLQQQFAAPQGAAPQVDQVYLRQQAQAQAQQLAYQQQQQQQLQQQQYIEQQNRQLAQQQYFQQQQQQQLQQQQRLQQEQQYVRQQQQLQQQALQQQQRSGFQAAPAVCQQQQQQSPLYKSSEYVQSGGVYAAGGAFNQPSARRVPSRADVNTAIENQEAPYQAFGQGLTAEQLRLSQYNAYATYGQAVAQSPIRPATQREPSEYAFDGLNPVYRQPQQQHQFAQGAPAEQQLGAPRVLDANNNSIAAPAPLPARSPARGYGSQQQQRGYGSGAQAESAYIGIPNDLHYAQNNQQRAYNGYGQESRPAYASSSRTSNQLPAASPLKLKPAAARELYAALSSENVRTALERDAPILQQLQQTQQTPAAYYNGQRVQGRAFVAPADQKYSEYNLDDLNGLRSVIDAPIR